MHQRDGVGQRTGSGGTPTLTESSQVRDCPNFGYLKLVAWHPHFITPPSPILTQNAPPPPPQPSPARRPVCVPRLSHAAAAASSTDGQAAAASQTAAAGQTSADSQTPRRPSQLLPKRPSQLLPGGGPRAPPTAPDKELELRRKLLDATVKRLLEQKDATNEEVQQLKANVAAAQKD